MLSLQEVFRAVDQLSAEELAELRAYVNQREVQIQPAHKLSPQERARKLDDAFNRFSEDLTSKELDEMIIAMNEEYIEPWDESEWKD